MPDTLTLDDVAEIPDAVVDPGVPGLWPAIINPVAVIPTIWRRLRQARQAIVEIRQTITEIAAEINAVETTLGLNPHGTAATVADRLSTIEARLTTLEGTTPP